MWSCVPTNPLRGIIQVFHHLKSSRPIDGCWRQSTECVCFANYQSWPRHVLTGRHAGVWSNNLIIARHPTVMCASRRSDGRERRRVGGRVQREGGGRSVAGKLNDSSTCRRSLEDREVRSGRTCKIVRRAFDRQTRLYIWYYMFVRRAFARHTRLHIWYYMFVRRACTSHTRL